MSHHLIWIIFQMVSHSLHTQRWLIHVWLILLDRVSDLFQAQNAVYLNVWSSSFHQNIRIHIDVVADALIPLTTVVTIAGLFQARLTQSSGQKYVARNVISYRELIKLCWVRDFVHHP